MTMMYITLLFLFILGITVANKHNDIMPFMSGCFYRYSYYDWRYETR